MSSLENSDTSTYEIQVANTYPATVTCVVWKKSSSGAPTPSPALIMPPSSVMSPGGGDTAHVVLTYPDPVTGNSVTITIPYGSSIVTTPIGCLWYTGPTSQVIVIVQTGVADPKPGE